MVVFAPHGKKALPVARLATHKLSVSVDEIVCLELIATSLEDKYTNTVLPNFVVVRCWQRLECPVTDILWVTPLPLHS